MEEGPIVLESFFCKADAEESEPEFEEDEDDDDSLSPSSSSSSSSSPSSTTVWCDVGGGGDLSVKVDVDACLDCVLADSILAPIALGPNTACRSSPKLTSSDRAENVLDGADRCFRPVVDVAVGRSCCEGDWD
jgi:hypothetical protein